MKTIACADIRADVPNITRLTLVITTEGSGLASVAETHAWQQTIADSELLVLRPIHLLARASPANRHLAPVPPHSHWAGYG